MDLLRNHQIKSGEIVIGDQMEQQDFDDYLKNRYWDQIKYYEDIARQNQKIYQ